MTFIEIKGIYSKLEYFEIHEWKIDNKHELNKLSDEEREELHEIFEKKFELLFNLAESQKMYLIQKYGKNMDLSSLVKLARSMGPESRSKILYEYGDRFTADSIRRLAKGISDGNIIRIIEKFSNIFSSYLISELCKEMNNANKEAIIYKFYDVLHAQDILHLAKGLDDGAKLHVIELCYDKLGWRIVELARNMDVETRKAIISGYSEYLDGYGIVEMAKDMDIESRKEIIRKNYRKLAWNIAELAGDMDNESKKKLIKKYSFVLEAVGIVELAKGLDDESKLKIIKKYRRTLKTPDIVNISKDMNDFNKNKVIKSFLKTLTSFDIIKLSKSMDEQDKLEVIKKYKDKIGNLGITLLSNDMDFIKDEINIKKITKSFSLPVNMTIGMEIESEGENFLEILKIFDFMGWNAKSDISLDNGAEVVSPILYPTNDTIKQIYIVTKVLTDIKQHSSSKCGGHIHIGADHLTSKQAYANLLDIWCNTEKILYAICNGENEAPRKGVVDFAKPISPDVAIALEKGSVNLSNEQELDTFVKELKQFQKGRYYGINLLNINSEKNTIEFRMANGTLDPELWIDNINLFGGIIAISEELAHIQEKDKLTEAEQKKLMIFNKLKGNINNEEKLKLLLELTGLDLEQYIYKYKYNARKVEEIEEFSKITGGVDISSKLKINDIANIAKNTSAQSQQEAMYKLAKEMENQQDKENLLAKD